MKTITINQTVMEIKHHKKMLLTTSKRINLLEFHKEFNNILNLKQ